MAVFTPSSVIVETTKPPNSEQEHFFLSYTRSMIKDVRTMVEAYHDLESRLQAQQTFPSPVEAWKEDHEEMKQILQYGREHGEKLVEQILTSKKYSNPLTVGEGTEDEVVEFAESSWYKDSSKTAQGENWGKIAYSQLNAIKCVVRTLPNSRL